MYTIHIKHLKYIDKTTFFGGNTSYVTCSELKLTPMHFSHVHSSTLGYMSDDNVINIQHKDQINKDIKFIKLEKLEFRQIDDFWINPHIFRVHFSVNTMHK